MSEQMITIPLSYYAGLIVYTITATITIIRLTILILNQDNAYRNQIVKYFRGAK